jgi:hypothetical protein
MRTVIGLPANASQTLRPVVSRVQTAIKGASQFYRRLVCSEPGTSLRSRPTTFTRITLFLIGAPPPQAERLAAIRPFGVAAILVGIPRGLSPVLRGNGEQATDCLCPTGLIGLQFPPRVDKSQLVSMEPDLDRRSSAAAKRSPRQWWFPHVDAPLRFAVGSQLPRRLPPTSLDKRTRRSGLRGNGNCHPALTGTRVRRSVMATDTNIAATTAVSAGQKTGHPSPCKSARRARRISDGVRATGGPAPFG